MEDLLLIEYTILSKFEFCNLFLFSLMNKSIFINYRRACSDDK